METLIYLDTHVVVWLYAGTTDLFSRNAKRAIEENSLLISPMVLLELEFLYEIKRLRVQAGTVQETLRETIGLEVCDAGFRKITDMARTLTWTRDPFDRVIVGHALSAGRGLLTKDRSIRRRVRSAIW